MGGQACVFYGAAEFSRDLDLLLLPDPENLERFKESLKDLRAELIAVPRFELNRLTGGHAVHFRCKREDAAGLRIDVMSAVRGGDAFEALWARRTVIEAEGEEIDLMSLSDLVVAKKTQRDKDWPMIRRLVEQSYFARLDNPGEKQIHFWLMELRTPELLVEATRLFANAAVRLSGKRAAVEVAMAGDLHVVTRTLEAEESAERLLDREYWAPLKRELEQLRRAERRP